MIEHRRSQRIEADCAVLMINQNDCIFGRICNVSHYGLYIETETPFPKKTDIDIEFFLPLENDVRCCLRARVTHSNSNGMGLMVYEHSQAAKAGIDSLMVQSEHMFCDDSEKTLPIPIRLVSSH